MAPMFLRGYIFFPPGNTQFSRRWQRSRSRITFFTSQVRLIKHLEEYNNTAYQSSQVKSSQARLIGALWRATIGFPHRTSLRKSKKPVRGHTSTGADGSRSTIFFYAFLRRRRGGHCKGRARVRRRVYDVLQYARDARNNEYRDRPSACFGNNAVIRSGETADDWPAAAMMSCVCVCVVRFFFFFKRTREEIVNARSPRRGVQLVL